MLLSQRQAIKNINIVSNDNTCCGEKIAGKGQGLMLESQNFKKIGHGRLPKERDFSLKTQSKKGSQLAMRQLEGACPRQTVQGNSAEAGGTWNVGGTAGKPLWLERNELDEMCEVHGSARCSLFLLWVCLDPNEYQLMTQEPSQRLQIFQNQSSGLSFLSHKVGMKVRTRPPLQNC